MMDESSALRHVLWNSRNKIAVFLCTVTVAVCIMGSAMYLVESPSNPGFSNIPQSIYWAIVTMTTVGYGDIIPQTFAGKILASGVILFGYSLIIVPTGFVTAEMVENHRRTGPPLCPVCKHGGHDRDANYCKFCGAALPEQADV